MQNKTQIYTDTLKLNFSLWPNWTRPDPPFPPNFLTRPDPTRPDPRVGSRVVQLCEASRGLSTTAELLVH